MHAIRRVQAHRLICIGKYAQHILAGVPSVKKLHTFIVVTKEVCGQKLIDEIMYVSIICIIR